MTRCRNRLVSGLPAFGATALLMVFSSTASAQATRFGPENIYAWVDMRLAYSDGERGWTEGGFGKLRYGGEGAASLRLAQAAVLWKPRLADTVTGYVLLQHVPDAQKKFGISEAYIQWKPVPTSGWRYSVRAGQMFPPISQEHDGTGWTTTRTLTPSAINSWVGEEVLVDGLEASVENTWGEHRLKLTAGGFTRDDTSGTLLSWRGWALHDMSSADNSQLRLPDGAQGYVLVFKTSQATFTQPLVEVDHRLGYYARLDWQPPALIAFNAEYYDNQGDPLAQRNGQWGWDTKFYNLGFRGQLTSKDALLGQYMNGRTMTGWRSSGQRLVDVGFDSAYILWSRSFSGAQKLSGRLDYFATKDLSSRLKDDNAEHGYALTLAWGRPVNTHLDMWIEGVHVSSKRPARATQNERAQQAQTLAQFGLKLHL